MEDPTSNERAARELILEATNIDFSEEDRQRLANDPFTQEMFAKNFPLPRIDGSNEKDIDPVVFLKERLDELKNRKSEYSVPVPAPASETWQTKEENK